MPTYDLTMRLAQVDERAGRPNEAAAKYAEILCGNPYLIEAWWGLSQTIRDPERVQYCLRRVLAITPYYSPIAQQLKQQARQLISEGPLPVAPLPTLASSLDTPIFH